MYKRDMTNSIDAGTWVSVTTVFGNVITKRATSPIITEGSFPIVWVCSPEEWDAALRENRPPNATPWPADDVVVAVLVD